MKHRASIIFVLGLVVLLAGCEGDPSVWKLSAESKGLWLAFSPAGSALAVRYETGNDTATEWRDRPKGEIRWQDKAPGYPGYDAVTVFNPAGDQVAAVERGQVRIFATDGMVKDKFQVEDSHIISLVWPHDEVLLLLREELTSPLTSLYLEQRDSKGEILKEPLFLVNEPELDWWRPFTPHGDLLAYPLNFHTLDVYDLQTGEQYEWDLQRALGFYNEDGEVNPDRRAIFAGSPSPDRKQVALGLHVQKPEQLLVMLVDIQTGEVMDEFLPARKDEIITALAYSPDSKLLAVSLNRFPDRALALYDLEKKETQTLCDGEDCCAKYPAFAPDGKTLATLCDQQVKFWDLSE